MSSIPLTTWLNDGEKYALVGIELNFEGTLAPDPMTPNLWALSAAAFNVPPHWREWLGSIRVGEVEGCNLFLASKVASATPGVLDGENIALRRRVLNFYTGLLLASTFAPAHDPVLLTGARQEGETDIRQQQNLDPPIPSLIRPYPAVTPDLLAIAARLAESLELLASTPIPNGRWRLFRTLNVYTTARTAGDIVDRIHQYCRCIDGLIVPKAGDTKRQFKSRTELFIGPTHHDLMGSVYDVRSAAEHLHENRYLETFNRDTRLDLVYKEALVEHIARTALAHVIGREALWEHFSNTSALEAFWSRPPEERRQIWGAATDPMAAVAGFDPRYINDGELGG